MTQVYLAFGSNIGDRSANIRAATALVSKRLAFFQSAPLYESKAVGYTDQAHFYNTVVTGETELAPVELLQFVKQIEQRVGRIARFRWGPREIDIDILLYGDAIIADEGLSIPHPSMHERDFVLVPLLDLAPDLVYPGTTTPIASFLTTLPIEQRSVLRRIKGVN